MATYTELFNLMQGNSDLRNKVSVAVIVAADTIRNEDAAIENHANRLIWAAQAFSDPQGVTKKMLMAVLASNKSASVLIIESADDVTIQSLVDGIIDLFATGV